MAKFQVVVSESYRTVYEIQANSEQEAEDRVMDNAEGKQLTFSCYQRFCTDTNEVKL